jgi:hypothetical protein
MSNIENDHLLHMIVKKNKLLRSSTNWGRSNFTTNNCIFYYVDLRKFVLISKVAHKMFIFKNLCWFLKHGIK